MTCSNSQECFQWIDQVPISFTELKSILSTLTSKETIKLSTSTSTDAQRRSKSQIKKPDRQRFIQSQLYGNAVINSFLISSSTNAIRSTRQDLEIPDVLVPPKRYVSSFKTLVHSTNNKQTQRLNYINDSVMIFKLSKEQSNNSSVVNSQIPSKSTSLSPTNTMVSIKNQQQQQQPPSPVRLSPVLKIEGQKRRVIHHDSSITIPPPPIDLSLTSNQMTTSASNHHHHQQPSHASMFSYRSAAAGGNTVRQRAIADPPSNSLLITAERFKTNLTSTMRPTRQQSISTLPYLSSQQTQKNVSQNIRSRIQLDKLKTSQNNYEYADPFTNCSQDLLNKFAHLTKLQLDTIEWEKRKRFTKKKPISNAFFQGKDSP